jgi:hypothetical protein
VELGGAGAAGAGSGLVEGAQVTGIGEHAATDGPGEGEGEGVGELAGGGVGEVEGGAGCDGCDGVVVCDIWRALPQAASIKARDKTASTELNLAGFMGLMTAKMNPSCARFPVNGK